MEKAAVENRTEYLIGDVARMVGLSRDALRFYEKKGVINARKKENGYRYYSEDDIYKLMYILYHRKMNSSLEDIEELMSGRGSVDYMREHIRQRMQEEEESLRRHRQAMTRLKLVERDMDKIEECMDRCSLRRFPLAYIMGNCDNLQHGLREWFRLSSNIAGLDMTYFYNVLTYTGKQLNLQGTQLLLYKELEQALGKEFDAGRYPMTEEKVCIYMVEQSRDTLPGFETIHKMVQWGHRHGIETEGTVYCNDMTSFFAKDSAVYCLELYMPAKRIVSQI